MAKKDWERGKEGERDRERKRERERKGSELSQSGYPSLVMVPPRSPGEARKCAKGGP